MRIISILWKARTESFIIESLEEWIYIICTAAFRKLDCFSYTDVGLGFYSVNPYSADVKHRLGLNYEDPTSQSEQVYATSWISSCEYIIPDFRDKESVNSKQYVRTVFKCTNTPSVPAYVYGIQLIKLTGKAITLCPAINYQPRNGSPSMRENGEKWYIYARNTLLKYTKTSRKYSLFLYCTHYLYTWLQWNSQG